MRPSSLLPLLHQNEGAMRPEVLRRLPGGARQGERSSATVARGWPKVGLARPHHVVSFTVKYITRYIFMTTLICSHNI